MSAVHRHVVAEDEGQTRDAEQLRPSLEDRQLPAGPAYECCQVGVGVFPRIARHALRVTAGTASAPEEEMDPSTRTLSADRRLRFAHKITGALSQSNAKANSPTTMHRSVRLDSSLTPRLLQGRHARGDRKSTRLNSSHVRISYAV